MTLSPESAFMRGLEDTLVRNGADPVKMRLDSARIPPLYRSANFDMLDGTRDPKAFNICQEFGRGGSYGGKRSLFLRGANGNGKTTLAVATTRLFVEQKGGDVKYVSTT